jgi:hypothetical protein
MHTLKRQSEFNLILVKSITASYFRRIVRSLFSMTLRLRDGWNDDTAETKSNNTGYKTWVIDHSPFPSIDRNYSILSTSHVF